MAKTVIADTGFWFALFDEKDRYHSIAEEWAEILLEHQFVVPWPCLYEILNTKFVRRNQWLQAMERRIKRGLVRFDDSPYREQALAQVFDQIQSRRTWSLTDLVIRGILADTSVRVAYLVTSNSRDFIDFNRVRGIELIDLESNSS